MLFPLEKYEEVPSERKNTLQVFITTCCNLNCKGCFARKVMGKRNQHISLEEYSKVLQRFKEKGGIQINLIGGEPLLHPKLREIIQLNRKEKIKTTIYTNGYFLKNYKKEDFEGVKVRVSVYSFEGLNKSLKSLGKFDIPVEFCFMISSKTNIKELVKSAKVIEKKFNCRVFFISSLRELDNKNKEFFEDTPMTLNLLKYKKLVCEFLQKYKGAMEIHVSKRGVFESTKVVAENKCKFANYFIGGKVIQCPYDIVNEKYQKDYQFGCRSCQHNNSCLMSKVVFVRKS